MHLLIPLKIAPDVAVKGVVKGVMIKVNADLETTTEDMKTKGQTIAGNETILTKETNNKIGETITSKITSIGETIESRIIKTGETTITNKIIKKDEITDRNSKRSVTITTDVTTKTDAVTINEIILSDLKNETTVETTWISVTSEEMANAVTGETIIATRKETTADVEIAEIEEVKEEEITKTSETQEMIEEVHANQGKTEVVQEMNANREKITETPNLLPLTTHQENSNLPISKRKLTITLNKQFLTLTISQETNSNKLRRQRLLPIRKRRGLKTLEMIEEQTIEKLVTIEITEIAVKNETAVIIETIETFVTIETTVINEIIEAVNASHSIETMTPLDKQLNRVNHLETTNLHVTIGECENKMQRKLNKRKKMHRRNSLKRMLLRLLKVCLS